MRGKATVGLAAVLLLLAGLAASPAAGTSAPDGGQPAPGSEPAAEAPDGGRPAPGSAPSSKAQPAASGGSGQLTVYDEIEVTGRASDMLGIAASATEG
ncbi:MAG TPA: hypothetical protein VE075_01475, partial [Thermoanaerobaculia bacterium]|nr:hypothetical protein [Thermoanaerobaculia bacterium]